ncbi:hypothetical protein X801_04175 [Opisthorchis viverrini]|uniref:Peptidase A2 domain-containing protein n=1 Tax=Opisthorchis viverrini TaxID=6198 RepID=A0A1S8WZS7_OPIVI|nr:hypothetical protein X801_04175 [Opisthorchis viverrini]
MDQCPEFIEMPVVSRIACVDRLRVCYLRLKPYHQAKLCRSRHACGFQLCVGKHHSLRHRPSSSKTENEPEPSEIASEGVHHSIADVPKSNILLAVVLDPIRGPERDVVINAFLDNGASTTLIHSSLLPKLGLKVDLQLKPVGIGLLIGCDVSKAHWVLKHRFEGPQDAFEVRGPLGWAVLGPLYSNPNNN